MFNPKLDHGILTLSMTDLGPERTPRVTTVSLWSAWPIFSASLNPSNEVEHQCWLLQATKFAVVYIGSDSNLN